MLPGRRSRRVGDQILKEIASLLLHTIRDPRVVGVTVTGIRMTDDLKRARVFYSLMGEAGEVARAQKGLESATGFIKREIGMRMELRYVPDIRFVHDPSLELGSRMERVLSGLQAGVDGEPDTDE